MTTSDTFPCLGPGWLRVAVRDEQTSQAFVAVLAHTLSDLNGQTGTRR